MPMDIMVWLRRCSGEAKKCSALKEKSAKIEELRKAVLVAT